MSLSDILSLFSCEIHVFTHHSLKFQDFFINRAPSMAKLCNAGKSKLLLHYSNLVTCFHMQFFRNKISLLLIITIHMVVSKLAS